MWDSIGELRTLSQALTWAAFGLAVLAAAATVGRYFVDRRGNELKAALAAETSVRAEADRKAREEAFAAQLAAAEASVIEAQNQATTADETAEAAIRQHEFQPLSPTLSISLRSRLEAFRTRFANRELTVFVDVESGSAARDRVAAQLGDILTSLQIGRHRRDTYVGTLPDHPITLVHGNGGEAIAHAFREAVAVFVSGQVAMKEQPTWPAGTLRLHLYGTPLFERNGATRVE